MKLYSYDEWGRVIGRNIDGANNESCLFDSLGRVTSIVNALCPTSTSFGYSYFDPSHPTNRVGTINYPNGQSTDFNYFGNTGDERLQEIKNLNPSSAVLSQYDYTYDAMGKIQTWQEQSDSNTPLLWTYGYDAADQLTGAVQTNTAISSPAVRSDSYGYDAAGNPTTFNVSGVSRSPSYNALNQLTGSTPSGNRVMGFTGSINGPATVTVNGAAATVNSSHYFSGIASLTPGSTSTVTLVATDSNGNSRTNLYQTTVPAELSYSPTFDADGNELSSGAGQTYTWDALNELASITYTGGASTVFTYDAMGRRISIVEKNSSGTVTGTKQLVWNANTIAEERNASDIVTKKFFAQGEQQSGANNYYTRDQLGSVREMVDGSGNIVARYSYGPHGKATLISGTNLATYQYTGDYTHYPSGLNLTKYRAYDSNTERWLSRDSIAERGGINLYEYVHDNPINAIDRFGMCECCLSEAYLALIYAKRLYGDAAGLDHLNTVTGVIPFAPQVPSVGSEEAGNEIVTGGALSLLNYVGAELEEGADSIEALGSGALGLLTGEGTISDADSLWSALSSFNKCKSKAASIPCCHFDLAQGVISQVQVQYKAFLAIQNGGTGSSLAPTFNSVLDPLGQ